MKQNKRKENLQMNVDVEELRRKYQKGTKIKLVEMYETKPVPAGTVGKVNFVDDIGTIHMIWENGSSLRISRRCGRI